MRDFLTAVGLAMVIEGVVYALFPGPMKRMLAAVEQMPPTLLRAMGLAAAAAGVIFIWLVRSAALSP